MDFTGKIETDVISIKIAMRVWGFTMKHGNITDVPGIKVGNVENREALTGLTVALMENGAVCGVDVRGSAPGTRETDLLHPINMIEKVHAICLSGGSAFGLEAATGVMQYLEEQGIGLDVGVAKVPIVPAAVLFDLQLGDGKVRPDKRMGYEAVSKAMRGRLGAGNIGAGCGATVGKLNGFQNAMKGGLGSASMELANGVVIGAIVAVNAVGDVRDPATGEILAGPVNPITGSIEDSIELLRKSAGPDVPFGSSTTIGIVAANVAMTKAEATKVAQVAQNAIARTIYPAHTMHDGDTIFALGTGEKTCNVDVVANMAAKVMEQAIVQAVKAAEPVGKMLAYRSFSDRADK